MMPLSNEILVLGGLALSDAGKIPVPSASTVLINAGTPAAAFK